MFDLNLLLWYALIRHWECLILPIEFRQGFDKNFLHKPFVGTPYGFMIWFDLLLAYTLVTTVKMFAQKKTFVAIVC